ncbi:unnamed protein product [Allacma fusca]|uniref:G-protein coupled receptors family 1 profile domain-containing protein n=1 Tax=Allacma fusca TaxID=39272 RepID=A0A8J2K6T2_9HEXA|nr:unnamed protein product [Allacma fusca]
MSGNIVSTLAKKKTRQLDLARLKCCLKHVYVEIYGNFKNNFNLGNWRLGGGIGCLVWLFLDVFFCTASILHLATLSVDRYLSLRFPWRFGREKSRSRLMLTILFVWFAAVSLALLLPISLWVKKHSQVQDSVLDKGQCVIPDPAYRVWASLVCFYLPLLAMVATYALTVRLLRKHPLRMPERNYSIPLKRRLQRGEETHFTPCAEVFGQQVSTETDSSSFSCELCEENSGRLKRKRTTPWKCRPGEGDKGNHVLTHINTTTLTTATASSATTTGATNSSFKEVIPSGAKLSPPNNICKVKTKTESISLTSFDYQIPASRTSSSTARYWDENVSRASWRLLARLSKNASNRRILRSERKATKVLGVVFFAFVGLWLPFFALNVTAALLPGSPNEHWFLHDQVMEGATWIGWTSSLINPFLYTAFNRDFRNAFSRLLRCKCRKQPPVRL